MPVYAAALSALRNSQVGNEIFSDIGVAAAWLIALNRVSANSSGLNRALNLWPSEDGWHSHNCRLALIDLPELSNR